MAVTMSQLFMQNLDAMRCESNGRVVPAYAAPEPDIAATLRSWLIILFGITRVGSTLDCSFWRGWFRSSFIGSTCGSRRASILCSIYLFEPLLISIII